MTMFGIFTMTYQKETCLYPLVVRGKVSHLKKIDYNSMEK